MKSNNKIIVHSTSGGKLFIKEKEFFSNGKVQGMVKKLLDSSVYKSIKAEKTSSASLKGVKL